MSLNGFADDVHSQFGEDGILAEVLRRIDASPLARPAEAPRWCVEFGAWDGIHLSNTRHLVESHGYCAVLIEGDPDRFADLVANSPSDRVHAIKAWVAIEGDLRLDALLASTPLPRDFDVLSIDVDGVDHHLWRSLVDHRPRIVCIEFNPTIPNRVRFVQPPDPSVQWGSSPRSIVELATDKGYDLVACTQVNLVFTSSEFTDAVLDGRRLTLDDVRDDGEAGISVFLAFDGTVHADRELIGFPWQGLRSRPLTLHSLPRRLRRVGPRPRWVRLASILPRRVVGRLRIMVRPRRLRRHWSGWTPEADEAASHGK